MKTENNDEVKWVAFFARERVTVNGQILQTVLVRRADYFAQLIERIGGKPGRDYEVIGEYSTPQEAWDRAGQWVKAGGPRSDLPVCGLN